MPNTDPTRDDRQPPTSARIETPASPARHQNPYVQFMCDQSLCEGTGQEFLARPSTTRLDLDQDAALANALTLVRLGCPVARLQAFDKKPALEHPYKDGSTTEEMVTTWWRERGRSGALLAYNLGMATGDRSGILVVDLDLYKPEYDGPQPGTPEFRELFGMDRPTVYTAKGGWHLYYHYPDGCGLTIGENKPFHAVDFRGNGGYVVVPPSVTSWVDANGQRYWGQYRYADGQIPDPTKLPFPPIKLLDALRGVATAAPAAPAPTVAAGEGHTGDPQDGRTWLAWAIMNAKPGERSRWCHKMACQLRDNRVPLDVALALGAEYAAAVTHRSDHPYTAKEAEGTIRSAYKTARRDPTPCPRGGDANTPGNGERPRQAGQVERLLRLATEGLLIYRTPDGDRCVGIPQPGGWYQHVRVRDSAVRDYLTLRYLDDTNRKDAPSQGTLDAVVGTLGALATQSGPPCPVYVRLAPAPEGNGLYLDLGHEGLAVRLTATRWEVVENPPVYFRRPKGFLPLPIPARGGSLADLRPFLNCPPTPEGDRNWRRYLAWLLGTFLPPGRGAYAHLFCVGEKGTGKTSIGRMLRKLVDPNVAELHQLPSTSQDLVRKASKSHVVAFDNLSHLNGDLSDALCRLSTGLADSKRALYTDDEEVIYSARNPAILNGINEDIAQRDDLLQRLIRVTMQRIGPDARRSEADLQAAFEAVYAHLLGALLDVVVVALRNLPGVQVSPLPRLADLARFLTAAEPALEADPQLGWTRGNFVRELYACETEARDAALECNTVLDTLLWFMRTDADFCAYGDEPPFRSARRQADGSHVWRGTTQALLVNLTAFAEEEGVNVHGHYTAWPSKHQKLGSILCRAVNDVKKSAVRC